MPLLPLMASLGCAFPQGVDPDGPVPADADADTDSDADADSDADVDLTTTTTVTTTPTGPPWLLPACTPDVPQDPIDVEYSYVSGDIIHADSYYVGGCRNHDFGACWEGAFDGERLVGQLVHDAKDDPCEEWTYVDVHIDLTPVRQQYRAVTGRQSGYLQIDIIGLGVYDYAF